jgi:predicted GTPase
MQPTPLPPNRPPLPLSETLSSIFNLNTPLTYKKLSTQTSTHLPRVLIFGDIQNGKSTLGNYILRESIIDKNNLKTPKGGWFPTKRQSTPVTTSIAFQNTDTLFLIDTPGYNNPNTHESSNQMNSIEILDLAKNLFSHKTYINGLIFSIMVKKSLVIEEGSIMTLYNMLISFGLENVDL